jgi:Leucine-rich repeat (LRR) protein
LIKNNLPVELFTLIDLSLGKTAWYVPLDLSMSSSATSYHGLLTAFVTDEVRMAESSLFTIQPSWCAFEGVSCGSPSVIGTPKYASVLEIVLRSKNLLGTLPSSIGSFGSLTKLDVGSNKISGTIPISVGALKSLQILSLHFNSLKGTIPAELANLKQLNVFNIRSNQLTTGSSTAAIDSLLQRTAALDLSDESESLLKQRPRHQMLKSASAIAACTRKYTPTPSSITEDCPP